MRSPLRSFAAAGPAMIMNSANASAASAADVVFLTESASWIGDERGSAAVTRAGGSASRASRSVVAELAAAAAGARPAAVELGLGLGGGGRHGLAQAVVPGAAAA